MSRYWKLAACALVPVVLGCGAYLIRAGGVSSPESNRPAYVGPTLIDVGTVEGGTTVAARFDISNSGTADLYIADVRTDCGCLGVFRVSEDGAVAGPFGGGRVAAGEVVKLEIRFAVRVTGGISARQTVQFQTNDPEHPSASITCVAMSGGKVASWPAAVEFGNVPCESSHSRVVELRNDARLGGAQVLSVSSDHPALVTAVYETPGEVSRMPSSEFAPFGELTGFLVIRLNAPKVRAVVSAVVTATLADASGRQYTLSVPVRAQAVPRYAFYPGEVTLPRRALEGTANSVQVICRNSLGHEMKLSLVRSPDWLTVDLKSGEDRAAIRVIEVTVRELVPRGQPRRTGTVLFEASDSNSRERIELPVVVEPSD